MGSIAQLCGIRPSTESDLPHHLAENHPAHPADFPAAAPLAGRGHGRVSGRTDHGYHRSLHHSAHVLRLLPKAEIIYEDAAARNAPDGCIVF